MPTSEQTLPPVVFLMGPTASGKSALAVALAQELNGEIISVDSALVYRGMNIGTAKPTLSERQGITHHLIDILDPKENFSTGEFKTQALMLIEKLHQRGKLPILVGGTMLYFNALSKGIAEMPPANPAIRQQLDEDLLHFGKDSLYQRLQTVDPESAARIHPNDPQRIQRALEVYAITGQPISDFYQQNQSDFPYSAIKLIVAPQHRQTLHQIIAERFNHMLAQGFIEEVEALRSRGDLNETLPSMRAVGYRQIWAYLEGVYDRASMIEKAIAATRQLAKRQFTWLRKETDALTLDSQQENLSNKVLISISKMLNLKLKK
jgi:tRNA dimethylallyltransferase